MKSKVLLWAIPSIWPKGSLNSCLGVHWELFYHALTIRLALFEMI